MERILGVGIDILSVDRFSKVLVRHFERAIEDLFCATELGDLSDVLDPCCRDEAWMFKHGASLLARKFAAKEATIKALVVPPQRSFSHRDIAIHGLDRFTISLSASLEELARDRKMTRLFGCTAASHSYVAATVIGVTNG